MKPNPDFLNLPLSFWANVRAISEHMGYIQRGSGKILAPSVDAMARKMEQLGLSSGHIATSGAPTDLGQSLHEYFEYRARVLNEYVEPKLMDVDRARRVSSTEM